MIKTLKRIEPLSLGKVLAVLYGLISLIFIPFALLAFGLANLAPNTGSPSNLSAPIGLGLGMMILMPVLYASMGFVTGLILAWAYNLIANRIGGIQIQLD